MKVAHVRVSKSGFHHDHFAKRWRRRTVKRDVLTLIAVCVVVAAFLAAGRYARRKVADAVQLQMEEIAKRTGITIEPGEVVLQGLTGVTMTGARVSFAAEGEARRTVARIPKVEVEANLIWVLLRRAFPLSVTIFDPDVSLVRRADGTWKLPLLDEARKTGAEGLGWDYVYSFIVHVKSGRLEVTQEGNNSAFRVEQIDLSVRSRADRRGFRVRSAFFLPSVSEERLSVQCWAYPLERTFEIRTEMTALRLPALGKFIPGSLADYIEGGVVDGELVVRVAAGKETLLRGPIAFSSLSVSDTPEFMRDITGTADGSIVINHETREVLIERLVVDTEVVRGSLSGTLAYGAREPEMELRAEFDLFPVDELAGMLAEQAFPTVSELCLVPGEEARLDAKLRGTVKRPEITLALSGPASRASFNMDTEPYGMVAADLDLEEFTVNWSAASGMSAELAVTDGTLRGGRIPFTITRLAGGVSFENGLATTDSLNLRLDEMPVSISGYASLSSSGVRSADLTFSSVIDDLSQNRYVSGLEKVNVSGPAKLTANLVKLEQFVRWDVDADLTNAVVRTDQFLHKAAGVNARLHLRCPIEGGGPFDTEVSLSLDETTVAGHATMSPGGPSSATVLTLQLDELKLTELMPCLNLPVDVVEDARTKLVYILNYEDGEFDIKTELSADRLAMASEADQNGEPFMIELDGVRMFTKEETAGYQGNLRCAKATVSPSIPALVKRGFHLEDMERIMSPIRIDAFIEEFVSEPYRAEQIQCAVVISESQIELASAKGRLAGGTFEFACNVLRDEKTFSLQYGCEGLDIEQILSPILENADKYSGELSANMAFSGEFDGSKPKAGKGSITITSGQLDSSYVLSQMQGLEEVQERPPLEFETLQCDFSLDNGTVNVSNLHLEKPGLVLKGQGTVTLDGYVDQLFTVEMSREVVDELSAKKRWRLLDLLRLPRLSTGPVTRTFRVTGRFGELETEVEKQPLHVEIIEGTLGISERIAVAGVTVLALPARIFTDILRD